MRYRKLEKKKKKKKEMKIKIKDLDKSKLSGGPHVREEHGLVAIRGGIVTCFFFVQPTTMDASPVYPVYTLSPAGPLSPSRPHQSHRHAPRSDLVP